MKYLGMVTLFSLLCLACIGIVLYCVQLQDNDACSFHYKGDDSKLPSTRLVLKTPVYLSIDYIIEGLGNMMFQHASLCGIAKSGLRVPVVYSGLPLRDYFQISAITSTTVRPGERWGKMVEFHASRYDKILVKIAEDSVADLELIGFFQSWMYFREVFHEIKSEFRFNSNINLRAEQFLSDSRIGPTDKLSRRPKENNTVLIGIHVRRGDILSEKFQKFGYSVPDSSYIEWAMRYFEKNLGSFKQVNFLVVSNEIKWCEQNIRTEGRRVTFSRGNSAIVDLALLANCDHVIMTVGTFGWWGAWLSGGQVVCYKNFTRKGSPLERSFSANRYDYFLPHWIGM